MGIPSNLPTFFFFFFFLFSSIPFWVSQATNFEVTNQCSYTVWAASTPSGGKQLKPGETWNIINMTTTGTSGRIWGRTNCSFNASGNGSCETGDCDNQFECRSYGATPVTLAEFSLNQYNNLDYYDLSLVDGFNIPMEISPNNSNCRSVKCAADINSECPVELETPGGCNHPCTVFKTDLYCCKSGNNCSATYLSGFFKSKCPDAYSYAYDDPSTFTCPTGSDYRVVFCPALSSPSPVSPPPYDASFTHMCVSVRMINVNVQY
ncbi:protein P21-like [Macadamia integrifolia]|uniref:protein P21-like n=1 Tax=Macadamia integrifolia TaxID=60698 RepID=UPI001C52A8F7|nr:protein P21-like [Macadamia integrifolia]